MKDDYLRTIKEAGFSNVRVLEETRFPVNVIRDESEQRKDIPAVKLKAEDADELTDAVASINVHAEKPRRR